MSDHPDLENSVVAYLVGAAEPDEADLMRVHLAGCEDCRRLVARLQQVVDALPLAVEELEPSKDLKSRIMKAATASSQTRAPAPSARIRSRLRARARARWRPLIRYPHTALAVLAIAFVGLGAWNLYLNDRLARVPTQQRVTTTTLSGQGQLAGSQATVVDLRDQGVAFVTFRHLPSTEAGKVYEIWLIGRSKIPVSGGVFQPDSDGTKTLVVAVDTKERTTIALTVEAGPQGTTAPTQAPSLAGTI